MVTQRSAQRGRTPGTGPITEPFWNEGVAAIKAYREREDIPKGEELRLPAVATVEVDGREVFVGFFVRDWANRLRLGAHQRPTWAKQCATLAKLGVTSQSCTSRSVDDPSPADFREAMRGRNDQPATRSKAPTGTPSLAKNADKNALLKAFDTLRADLQREKPYMAITSADVREGHERGLLPYGYLDLFDRPGAPFAERGLPDVNEAVVRRRADRFSRGRPERKLEALANLRALLGIRPVDAPLTDADLHVGRRLGVIPPMSSFIGPRRQWRTIDTLNNEIATWRTMQRAQVATAGKPGAERS